MKRNLDNPNLRDALPGIPDECHDALMKAAFSVKEEEKVKKFTLRTALIAALIIAATAAVAIAAGNILGWNDFLKQYANVSVPKAALEAMHAPDGMKWQLGNMVFTVNELLNDGHHVYATTEVRTADGSMALMTGEPDDTVGAYGKVTKALTDKLGIDPGMTWLEAARKLKLPLYNVRACLEMEDPDDTADGGDGLEDPLWNEDGSVSYFSSHSLKTGNVGESVKVRLYLRAVRIDTETGKETDPDTGWKRTDAFDVKTQPVLEEKEYLPEKPVSFSGGYTLESISAKRYVTGAFLTMRFKAAPDADKEKAEQLYLPLTDQDGKTFTDGMGLSDGIDTDAWPTVTVEKMIGCEALPKSITVDGKVTLK